MNDDLQCISDGCIAEHPEYRGYRLGLIHRPEGSPKTSYCGAFICTNCISELAVPFIASGPVERMMVQRAITRKLEQ